MERNLEKMVKNLSIQLSVGMDCKLQDRKIASMEVNKSAIQKFVVPRCAVVSRHRVIALHQNRVATFGDDLVYFLGPVETMNLEHLRTG
jgi:hypothetical protein